MSRTIVHFPSVHLQMTIALQYKNIVAEILYYTEILYYILSTCATIINDITIMEKCSAVAKVP